MAPNQAWVEIGCVDMEQDREMRFWNPVENLSLKHDHNALQCAHSNKTNMQFSTLAQEIWLV